MKPIVSSSGCPFTDIMYMMSRLKSTEEIKENRMNKEEAAKELAVLEAKIKEIKEGLERDDKKPWRAEINCGYWIIGSFGAIDRDTEDGMDFDDERYNKGNYFKTGQEAKDSLIYKVINDKWHYWVAGVNEKPDEVPDGCEVFITNGSEWRDELNNRPDVWNNNPRRWPKHA